MTKTDNKQEFDYFAILLPIFNESGLIEEFIDKLEQQIGLLNENFKVIFINDGSTDNTVELISNYNLNFSNIDIEIIELNSNSGHQNAIRQGIIHINTNYISKIKGIIIMDSDGEDDPSAISELVKFKNFDIIFVSRGKRKEKISFKIGYFFYKIIFKIITGRSINFGNYSLLSPRVVKSISNKHFFHYSAFLSKQKFEIKKIKFDRLKRIDGKSKMSFKNLLFHGLKSFIEYIEEIVYFQIKLFIVLLFFLSVTSIYILYSKFIVKNAVLGWASSILTELLNSTLIMFSTIILTTLLLTIKNMIDQNSIISKRIL